MTQLNARRPAEGWVTLGLVVALALIVAWAIDDPAWVNGRDTLTDCLPLFALGGVAIGFMGPKLGWGRWTTHLMGAVFAALLIPIFAGWAIEPGVSIGQAFQRVAHDSIDAYLDLAWRGYRLTDQEIHYTLVLGILVWGTMQFASYAVFGHHRPMAAIVIMGLLLVGNMAITDRPQLSFLVAFTACALFLLIQMHAFDERSTWIRRRIGDPSTISSLYLRGGTVFIVAAMAGSMLLTQRAASAPLAGAWTGINDRLVDLGEVLSGLLPNGGAFRPMGKLSFGETAQISNLWFSDDRTAFTATVPKDYQEERWRAATYDTFELTGWAQSKDQTTPYPVEAGQPLLEMSPENPRDDLTTEAEVRVTPFDYRESMLVVPGAPATVDRAADTILFGKGGWFANVAFRDGSGGSYTATSAVLKIETDKGAQAEGVTAGKLRNAGNAYPPELLARYTSIPTGAMGPAADQLLQDMLAASPSLNPYDLAVTMQDYLRSDRFDYDIDLRDVQCNTASKVECFAQTKRGYCLHFASAMAILLRQAVPDHPIPTRLVQGFLPGEAEGATTTVRIRDAHAWVEVYFPSYGWIPFDPTRDVGRPTEVPVGVPVVAPSFAAFPSFSFGPDEVDPKLGPGVPPPGGDGPPGSNGPGPDRAVLMTVAILLGLTILVLAVVAWLRGPRGEVSPDAAWKTMARTASRFGYAPRPTQTVYEYATTLGDLVPVAERDIQVIASAKVETNYARIKLGGARLDAVKDATRRLRISLLRLLFRRPRRRRRA